MQAPNVSTLTNTQSYTIFVAIELSQKSWLVTVHSPDRDRMSRRKLEGEAKHKGLLELIDRERQRAARALGSVPAVTSCYEAGYDGFWLHHVLTAAGVTSYVFDPASIAVEQRRRRAKTDRIDGEQLLRTLMAYRRGEPRVVRIVRVPDPAQEDARRGTRERGRLVMECTAHVSRLKGLLRQKGFSVGNPRRRDWLGWLDEQRDPQGQPVPPRLLAEVKREYARLRLVCDQLEELSKPEGLVEEAPVKEMRRRRDELFQLKGVGPVFAAVLTNEVFYKDFRNRREVAAYFGLTPSPWRSGGIDREQGISKAGNPRARSTAIELAWMWRRHQPDSALTKWFNERTLKASSKRARRIAIVAMARKLMVAQWRYLTTGLVPEQAMLKA